MSKKKRRYLVFSLNYYPEIVGVGKYSGEFVNELCDRGHEVTVVCGNPHYPLGYNYEKSNNKFSKTKLKNLTILRTPVYFKKRLGTKYRILSHLFWAFSIIYFLPIISRNRYDVMLLVAPALLGMLILKPFSFFKNSLLWVHFHDFEVSAAIELKLLQNKIMIWFAKKFESWCLNSAEVISCVSNTMKLRLEILNPNLKNILVFRNWSDRQIFEKNILQDEKAEKKKLGIPIGKRILLYSGSLSIKQGNSLFELISKLCIEDDNFYLIICSNNFGTTPLIEKLGSHKNIKVMSLLPQDSFHKLIQCADFHLLPHQDSLSKSLLPSKLNTMLMSGQPIITNCDKNTELGKLISHSGIFVNENTDVFKLSVKLKNIINEELKAIKLQSNSTFEKNFDKTIVIEKFLLQLEKILKGKFNIKNE